jgi:NADPH:quinone reductase-like Zn-dependent oxidoreductase
MERQVAVATSKTIRIHKFGGPEVLQLEDLPLPEPQGDEMSIRVHAASINPVDWKIRAGTYPRITAEHLPVALGRDVSGVVEKAGPNAPFKPGDAIYAFLGRDRGGYTERMIIKPGEAAPKPKSLDHVHAAAVPLAAITAWQGLFDHGGLKSGERVLIHAGNGGVGHLAVQFAKAKGAWVATTCSGVDIDFVKGLGADQVIDYRAQKFEELVQPVDLVLDLVAGPIQERSWAVVKNRGRLVSALGQVSEERAKQAGATGQSFVARVDAGQLAEVGALIDAGRVRVEVQAVLPFAEVARAQQMMEKEHTRGKIVLRMV